MKDVYNSNVFLCLPDCQDTNTYDWSLVTINHGNAKPLFCQVDLKAHPGLMIRSKCLVPKCTPPQAIMDLETSPRGVLRVHVVLCRRFRREV